MSALDALFRWVHVFVGIIWIGHLYFFNFVNAHFAATLDADAKKKVVPELMPRALYWFRMGALWTWLTGVLRAMMLFYHGGMLFEGEVAWGAPSIVMILVVYLAGPLAYDLLFKAGLGKNPLVGALAGWLGASAIVFLMSEWAGFSYRGYVIHLGALFGTIMAFNVWMRIWPSQRQIITAVKAGQAPDPALVALAGMRSKHNTYMSVPLLWTMIDAHTTYFSGGNLGIPSDAAWITLPVAIAVGWGIAKFCFKIAPGVKGL